MVSFKQAADGDLSFIREFAQNEFDENNFAQMLPKLYADNAKSEAQHTFLYDNDEIKGMFALQIKDFFIADIKVRVGWIGTVCVKSSVRGCGYLSQIINYANKLLMHNNCDIAVLGGQRQRYKRFGYEYGGSHWTFSFTKRNLKDINDKNLTLKPLNENEEWLDLAYNLYCKDLITGARTKNEFYNTLSSWNSQPYAVVNENTFTGYCSLQMCENSVQCYEMRLLNSKLALSCCKAILNKSLKPKLIIFQCLWADINATELLSQECESARLAENHSYKVFNWQKIILAGLRLKQKCNYPLEKGELIIQIQNSGIYKTRISQQNEITVEGCLSAETVDLNLTQEQAVFMLLGHTSNLQKVKIAGWLPLSLGFSWLDGI